MKFKSLFLVGILCCSCAVHQRSNIPSEEELVIEMKRASSRGGLIETALEGLFFGASFLAEKSSKSLSNSYSQSISLNDYYNRDLGEVEKTYKEIHIKKYSKPSVATDRSKMENLISGDLEALPKSRGNTQALVMADILRPEDDDLMNFHAVIELISDSDNPGITRLSFNELRLFFSKTKMYEDLDLNARVSIAIDGQWRDADGSPKTATLIEQEYDFKKLKYGAGNLIDQPILSPWYVDIPPDSYRDEEYEFGVVQVRVQLEEYEGNKSKYINKLPSILSDNKDAIISNGASAIQKIAN